MASIGAIFTSTHHTKQLNPLPNSSANRMVNHSSSCLLVKGRWSHLKTGLALVDVWQASETSHSKSSLGNFQHQAWIVIFLVNRYVQLSFDGEKCVLLLCVCKVIFLRSGHILTLHMYITCCNWEIMFSSLFIHYPGRITHKNEVITTRNISYHYCSGLQLHVMANSLYH